MPEAKGGQVASTTHRTALVLLLMWVGRPAPGSSEARPGAAVQVVATCKHYAAYSLEAADGWTRQSFDARVDDRCMLALAVPARVS